jgi:hypothetical protein
VSAPDPSGGKIADPGTKTPLISVSRAGTEGSTRSGGLESPVDRLAAAGQKVEPWVKQKE